MRRECLMLMVCLITGIHQVAAQSNLGFEDGLTGWITSGNVAVDHVNMLSGTAAARIGQGKGSIMQRIEAGPFSIVEFQAQVKSGAGNSNMYSFIRFYNKNNELLLEYRNQASSTDWKNTGHYTEAPFNTSYFMCGIESDPALQGYVYVDSCRINVEKVDARHAPQINPDQYLRPFINSDTIYNETVLLYTSGSQPASGKLLYAPAKILSIKSFDLRSLYQPGSDYVLKGNTITRTPHSRMPARADTSFNTTGNLAWYDLQSQWVVVTYTSKEKWNGPRVAYKGHRMPHTMAKLSSKSPLTIIAYGMSITRGLNVSSYDTVPPYMPAYVDLFVHGLKTIYRYNDIRAYNAGLPGATAEWGSQYADKYINPVRPDLVILDFGMNDFWRMPPAEFKTHIRLMIDKIKKANPQAEYMLLSNMEFDPDYVLNSDSNKVFYQSNMQGYNRALQKLETTGVIDLDMTTMSHFIYQRKKAKDCIANPLHPNDYLARWYAQGMIALLNRTIANKKTASKASR